MSTHCHIIEHLFADAKALLEKLQAAARRLRAGGQAWMREGIFLKFLEPLIGSKYTKIPKVATLTKGRDETQRTRITCQKVGQCSSTPNSTHHVSKQSNRQCFQTGTRQ
jgi:hypothetical protein